jgi:cytochrome c-type biogenesis protein CcmH
MDQSASRPVRLAPKPGARAVVSADERDALEHRIRCQCGCTLDVYTCRTTDFSCQVSPSMHRDVMVLVSGGYNAQEIIDAFVGVYGERVLMAPPATGFNLLGWVAPFAALGGGAILVAVLLRTWRRPAGSIASPRVSPTRSSDATDEELARLDAAVRDDR